MIKSEVNIIFRSILLSCSALLCATCSSGNMRENEGNVKEEEKTGELHYSPKEYDENRGVSSEDDIELFGVKAKRNEVSVLENLSQAGVLKIDSLSAVDGEFKFAIVEFAGVKFGVNPGLTFVTSRNDMTAVNSIVDEIDKYYKSGHSEDGDSDDPLNIYYSWGGILEPEKPWIRLRPVHSSDGGLTMMISL